MFTMRDLEGLVKKLKIRGDERRRKVTGLGNFTASYLLLHKQKSLETKIVSRLDY